MEQRRQNPGVADMNEETFGQGQPAPSSLPKLIEDARRYLATHSYDSEERMTLRACVDELEKRQHVSLGEADYRTYCAHGADRMAEGTPASLALVADMLATWGSDCMPANEQGQAPFGRILIDSAQAEIRAFLSLLPSGAAIPESTNSEAAA